MNELDLSPDLCRDLALHNPLGIKITEDEVRSWAVIVWPSICVRDYKDKKRALVSWWMRIRESDIDQARERLQRMAKEDEIAVLESQVEPTPNVVVVDFAARVR